MRATQLRAPRQRAAIRIGAAAVLAVLAAEGAVLLLRPRDGSVTPAGVRESDYFTPREIARGRDFRSGQRDLFVISLGVEAAILGAAALWRPQPARRALSTLAARPLLGTAAAGAAISVALAVATAPVGAVDHRRSTDVGLSTQSWGGWLGDQAKGTAIAAILAGGGALLVGIGVRRLPRGWPIATAAGAVVVSAAFVWVAPVLLEPVFNRFEPLPDGKLRNEVLSLAREAGVDVGQVYKVDASRRSTGLNAYVDGIGSTKRVVLYDNLISRSRPAEVRSVVAHELGHQKGRDIQRGLLWLALVAPFGVLLAREISAPLLARSGDPLGSPGSIPALAVGLGISAFLLGGVSNQLSRSIERRADTVALELTHDPRAMIALQRDLVRTNVGEPEPPALWSALFATHPSAVDRIGAAVAWERGARP